MMVIDTKLIEKYVDTSFGIADARVYPGGATVWALIGYLRAADNDIDQVIHDYDLPPEAMQAALLYYKKYKKAIDARLLLNELA